MFSERPFADGRPTAVFVFNALRVDAGRLTQQWLARLRTFDSSGWATHVVLINKDPDLGKTIAKLTKQGRIPAGTNAHHYALRDRRIRALWSGPLPEGGTIDPRVGDWLDWLTGQIPGAVILADSPAAYPYLSHMTNPLVARVASVHLSHLEQGADPRTGPLAARFDDRFAGHLDAFDAIVCETQAQADDLRLRFGADLPVSTIGPFLHLAAEAPARTSPGEALTILSVGALEPVSGHEQVLDALPAVLAAHPRATLRILGVGAQADPLRARAEALGVGDRVDIVTRGRELDQHLGDAAVLVWAAGRESWPLTLARALAAGVPVVAVDNRYGPREIVTSSDLGELVMPGTELSSAIGRTLARWSRDEQEPVADVVQAAAGPLLRRVDPRAVGAQWTGLARQLADDTCDHRSPTLLVETVSTNTRVVRLPGVLADSASDLTTWSCELPGMPEPAGWLTEVGSATAEEVDEEPPVHPHAAGPTREVVAYLRSNILAFGAVELDRPLRVEFTDGSAVVPLRTTGFDERIIASRVGNATLRREGDGSLWVEPRPELLFAQSVDGRIVVRTSPDAAVSDVTHAVSWSVDIDWADMVPTSEGAAFTGVLRARSLAPADDSAPAICVSDVGGFSRVVGQLHYTGEPRIDGLEWAADVRGVLATTPLVATTELARGALALHVGFPGLPVSIGGLWTHGRRERIQLESERGMVTLLPSPGGRVIVAPGKGIRARVSGAVRGVVTRD